MTALGEKRPGAGGPKTEEGRARALANLRPGKKRKDWHGAYSINEATPEVRELSQQIRELLNGDGLTHIRPADEASVQLAATALRRVQQCDAYIEANGLTDTAGKLRPVCELQIKCINAAAQLLSQLGLSPASRAKLGLTRGQAATLAEVLTELESHTEGGNEGA